MILELINCLLPKEMNTGFSSILFHRTNFVIVIGPVQALESVIYGGLFVKCRVSVFSGIGPDINI